MSLFDARLREMRFLARLDRDGPTQIAGPNDGGAERQMIVSLVDQGYVNGIDSLTTSSHAYGALMAVKEKLAADLMQLLSTRSDPSYVVEVRISHRGRVRLSELEQQLRTGRDRDDTGLLFAKRHLKMDLAIAVLSATQENPLSVAFLDMNGLTGINNKHGHGVGDKALEAFFEAIVSTLGQCGEVYRNGGDEVVAILPNVADEQASKLLDGFVRQLGKDAFSLGDATNKTTLTASCGATSITDHHDDGVDEILVRADTVLYRAKHVAGTPKEYTGRVSAIAVGDGSVRTYPEAPTSLA